ncbi:Oidioi.mRNA.OKI2018_I69.XSR.g13962.t1.cds [Oikopleura dioica]|uniref:Oidioi.mRNA.OKI2018_I69.XSR.g13962.t1.cds n=1 Tax=Oikopleura dioica TaxID=34765 RepID=A0ABN7SD89_OIKDI|nr:Oidioi.mRNA.OKI2018_I69.XSR.g13962.t1.cds [Oikopleura dioica]
MALAGKWNKARNENGEAFLTALGVDKAAMERAANASCVTEITDSGDKVVIVRNYNNGEKIDTNTITIGQESELTGPRGNPFKATVTREGDKLVGVGSGGKMKIALEVVGGELVETVEAIEQKMTMKRFHTKA